MNEQLKKLFEQSWFNNADPAYGKRFSIDDSMGESFDAEKFAKLIVQDMLRLLEQYSRDSFPKDIMYDFDRGYLAGLSTAHKAIEETFRS